jgi:hypothetical protein
MTIHHLHPQDVVMNIHISCVYCKTTSGPFEKDHIALVDACKSCNLSKGNKTLREWRNDLSPALYKQEENCMAILLEKKNLLNNDHRNILDRFRHAYPVGMKQWEAAKIILQCNGNQALSAVEIQDKISERGLWFSKKGKTPAATLAVALRGRPEFLSTGRKGESKWLLKP